MNEHVQFFMFYADQHKTFDTNYLNDGNVIEQVYQFVVTEDNEDFVELMNRVRKYPVAKYDDNNVAFITFKSKGEFQTYHVVWCYAKTNVNKLSYYL